MKKSLLLTYFFPPEPGGIQNYLYNLIKYLPKDKVFVFTDTSSSFEEFDQKQPFKIFRQKIKSPWRYLHLTFLPLLLKLLKLIKKERIEILILGHFFVPFAISALFLAKFKKIPFVISTHGLEILQAEKSFWQKRILFACLDRAKNIIVTSDFMRKRFEKNYPTLNLSKKIIKITPGVDTNFFRPDLDVKNLRKELKLENKKIILTCGRIVRRKGYENVIKALRKISEEVRGVCYLIVGDGPYKKNLEVLVKSIDLPFRVMFCGEVSQPDLPYYYNLADFFVMPAIETKEDIEGFGLVYLEAAACAKPVIAARAFGAMEAVKDGQTGFLIDPKNISDLALKIKTLLQNEKLAKRMGLLGRKFVLENFLWKDKAKILRTLL